MKDRRPKSVKPLDLGIVLRQQEIRSLDALLLVCKKAGRLWRRSVVDRGLWDAGENCRNLLLFGLLTPQTDDWRTGIGFASGDIFPLAYTLIGKKALVCTDFRFLHPPLSRGDVPNILDCELFHIGRRRSSRLYVECECGPQGKCGHARDVAALEKAAGDPLESFHIQMFF